MNCIDPEHHKALVFPCQTCFQYAHGRGPDIVRVIDHLMRLDNHTVRNSLVIASQVGMTREQTLAYIALTLLHINQALQQDLQGALENRQVIYQVGADYVHS